MASQSRQVLRPLLHQLAPPRRAAAAAAGRRRRPLSTSSSSTTTAAASPPPSATTAGVGGGAAAPEAAAAEEAGSWSRKFKIAAFVLAPLSLPAGLVTAIVYDEEFRDDVDRRFPEIVDAVRQRVGFEEDLRRRRADLEKAFISSQPVGVTVQLQSGARYAEERVSPLKTLGELYDTLVGGQAAGAGPVVAMDFSDIGGDDASSSSSPLAPSSEMPATPDETTEAPHPNDQLAVVPKPLRGVVGSSLWEVMAAQGAAGTGAGGDSISMKRQMGQRSERQAQIDALEASLSDIDEEVAILREGLRTGSSLRAIDDIHGDIAYLNMRRREVKRELRGLGRWWRW